MSNQSIVFYGDKHDSNGQKKPWMFYSIVYAGSQGNDHQIKVDACSNGCDKTLEKNYFINSHSTPVISDAVENVAQQLISAPAHNNLDYQRSDLKQ